MSATTAALRRLVESFNPQVTVEVRVDQLIALLDQQDRLEAKLDQLERKCDVLVKACASVQAALGTPDHHLS